ncbi:hypothetical protein Purlil1_12681 [Purpureocillium lilacinum]|uniref:Uncharacterized protein n=1 Tax=Purpureocillium lilacinum TaxID=33203 RepID=A0ABR0BG92_PURLI|nr:hypothetical protein Purlil1_12681 [Purpureocillium lilacinum]
MVMDRGNSTNRALPPPPPYEEVCGATNDTRRTHRHDDAASLPSVWFEAAVRDKARQIFNSNPANESLTGRGIDPPIGGSSWQEASESVQMQWKRFEYWDEAWDQTGTPDATWPHQKAWNMRQPRSPTPLFGCGIEARDDRYEDGPKASRPIQVFLADAWEMLRSKTYSDNMCPDDIMKSLFSDVAAMWKNRGLNWIWPGNVPGLEWPPPGGADRNSEGQPRRGRQHDEANNRAGAPLQIAPSGRGQAKRSRDGEELGGDVCGSTVGKRRKLEHHDEPGPNPAVNILNGAVRYRPLSGTEAHTGACAVDKCGRWVTRTRKRTAKAGPFSWFGETAEKCQTEPYRTGWFIARVTGPRLWSPDITSLNLDSWRHNRETVTMSRTMDVSRCQALARSPSKNGFWHLPEARLSARDSSAAQTEHLEGLVRSPSPSIVFPGGIGSYLETAAFDRLR